MCCRVLLRGQSKSCGHLLDKLGTPGSDMHNTLGKTACKFAADFNRTEIYCCCCELWELLRLVSSQEIRFGRMFSTRRQKFRRFNMLSDSVWLPLQLLSRDIDVLSFESEAAASNTAAATSTYHTTKQRGWWL